jgi:integrase
MSPLPIPRCSSPSSTRALPCSVTRPERPQSEALNRPDQRDPLTFLEGPIEWDRADAPGRNPILHGDIHRAPNRLPKFLTDQQAAQSWPPPRAHHLPRYPLVAQVLARTGLRAGELCDLADDNVTGIGDAY